MSSQPVEACEVCGFVWASVPREQVGSRIREGARGIVATLEADPAAAVVRATPQRWSRLEYAAHVRDVLLHVRDRFVIGLAEHDPTFKPLYRDERVDLGLYRADTVALVSAELTVAAGLFARTFDQIDDAALARSVQYAYPTMQTRTLLWMGQQVLHEVEHHRADIDA